MVSKKVNIIVYQQNALSKGVTVNTRVQSPTRTFKLRCTNN